MKEMSSVLKGHRWVLYGYVCRVPFLLLLTESGLSCRYASMETMLEEGMKGGRGLGDCLEE